MTPVFNYIQNLEIEFQSVRFGWIEFKLTLGEKSFETRFSEVYDPILELKSWLEAISIGVRQCSFFFETEGDEIKFDYERIYSGKEIFTVTRPYEDSEIFLSDYIDCHQLVKAFYYGLLDFRNSPRFDKDEWEVEYMWERLSAALKFDYETLVNYFSMFERDDLKSLLFKADPQHIVSFSGASDAEGFKLYIETTFEGKELPPEHEVIRTPIEWQVPEDYNDWANEKKIKFVKECLNAPTSGFKGTKIEKIKSQIIDDFLNRKQT